MRGGAWTHQPRARSGMRTWTEWGKGWVRYGSYIRAIQAGAAYRGRGGQIGQEGVWVNGMGDMGDMGDMGAAYRGRSGQIGQEGVDGRRAGGVSEYAVEV